MHLNKPNQSVQVSSSRLKISPVICGVFFCADLPLSYPARTQTGASNTGFLAIVDSDTADNTALMFPTLEQLSLVLRESLPEETLDSLNLGPRGRM